MPTPRHPSPPAEDPALTPPVLLDEVTHLAAHLELGDAGVGGWPADGELSLSVHDGESWRGRLSDSALEAAAHHWAGRADPTGPNEAELLAMLRVAVNYDAAFYGLSVDWDHARTDVDAGTARVAARVTDIPDRLIGVTSHRATVTVELVDMHPTYATWHLSELNGDLLTEEVLAQPDIDGPNIEAIWANARTAWATQARTHGLNPAEDLTLNLSINELAEGTCGLLEVSAAVHVDSPDRPLNG